MPYFCSGQKNKEKYGVRLEYLDEAGLLMVCTSLIPANKRASLVLLPPALAQPVVLSPSRVEQRSFKNTKAEEVPRPQCPLSLGEGGVEATLILFHAQGRVCFH